MSKTLNYIGKVLLYRKFLNAGLKEHTIVHSVKFNSFSIAVQLLLSTHIVLADILLGVCTVADLVV